ncbi:MAG: Elongation factor Ts [uncultured bacterium]|nr:MAG: Elongation factor Ts [uncultured bacterium]
MSINAQDVKTLREKTGAGMMDCKKALTESNGNFEEAVDYLKKQGLAKAVKKGGRIAADGLVFSTIAGSTGLVLELNCETDFVARTDDFVNFGNQLVQTILKNKPTSLEEALAVKMDERTIEESLNDKIAKIGEKLSLRRFKIVTAKAGGKLGLYSHAGGKIAVLLEVTGDKIDDEVIRNLAMQITAMSPQYTDKSEVPQDILDREKEIQLAQLIESGKPANILEKIIVGKLDKFAGEMSLMQQSYVKDSSGKTSVAAYLKTVDPQAKVVQFLRYEVGEGLEKRKDDFAQEVASMVK